MLESISVCQARIPLRAAEGNPLEPLRLRRAAECAPYPTVKYPDYGSRISPRIEVENCSRDIPEAVSLVEVVNHERLFLRQQRCPGVAQIAIAAICS
jgi:hypothetical protein